MTAPRIEVDFEKIGHNARVLVARANDVGVGITGVTKAMLGHPRLAQTLLAAGVDALADSRVENIERMRGARSDDPSGGSSPQPPLVLLRSPAPSQVDRVVAAVDISCNSEIAVLELLSAAALRRQVVHGVLVMVELGDLREGVLAADLVETVARALDLPGIEVKGIGTNLACQSGVVPDACNMAELSHLAEAVESSLGIVLEYVSGGNSANLGWLIGGGDPGRVNDLRLGESILLGREPLTRSRLEGLHGDAVGLVAEVIESKRKPTRPWGRTAQAAFGPPRAVDRRPGAWQTILALGHQDTDPEGLEPPAGVRILGASSDHLIVETGECLRPGRELRFTPSYSALLRSMTSPFVTVVDAAEPAARVA